MTPSQRAKAHNNISLVFVLVALVLLAVLAVTVHGAVTDAAEGVRCGLDAAACR